MVLVCGMWVPQLVVIALFAFGFGFFYFKRSSGRGSALGSVTPGLDALRAGFLQTRAPDEPDPVCVVAFHYSTLKVEQVTIGVTDRRILVIKGAGTMHTFPYDDEGEHLPSAQKQQQRRGFFDWRHGSFGDGTKGYKPIVKDHPPFTGEEWRMYPTLDGFPEQKANLREFSRRFYFQWFYD